MFDSIAKNNVTKFGLFALPRFGKTIVCFENLNNLIPLNKDKNISFFISSRTDFISAIISDFNKFKNRWNFNVLIKDGNKTIKLMSDNSTNHTMICCTKQFLQNCNSIENINAKITEVEISNNNTLVFHYDEAHIAGETDITKDIIEKINPLCSIFITGTPQSILTNTLDFTQENMFCYDLLSQEKDILIGDSLLLDKCAETASGALLFDTQSNTWVNDKTMLEELKKANIGGNLNKVIESYKEIIDRYVEKHLTPVEQLELF